MTAEALQRAIARYLASKGWNVALVADIAIVTEHGSAIVHNVVMPFMGAKNLTKGGETTDTPHMPRISTTASKGAGNRKTSTKATATGGKAKTAKSKPAATGRAKKATS